MAFSINQTEVSTKLLIVWTFSYGHMDITSKHFVRCPYQLWMLNFIKNRVILSHNNGLARSSSLVHATSVLRRLALIISSSCKPISNWSPIPRIYCGSKFLLSKQRIFVYEQEGYSFFTEFDSHLRGVDTNRIDAKVNFTKSLCKQNWPRQLTCMWWWPIGHSRDLGLFVKRSKLSRTLSSRLKILFLLTTFPAKC